MIWYFPATVDEHSLDLSQHAHERALDREIHLGPEHPPGRYTLTFVFSGVALTRDDVKRAVTESPSTDLPRSTQVLVIE